MNGDFHRDRVRGARVLALALVLSAAALTPGCYTAEQWSALNGLNAQLEAAAGELGKWKAEYDDIREQITAGTLDFSDVAPKLERLAALIAEANVRKDAIREKLNAVKASGLGIWQIIGATLLTLATGATGAGALGMLKNKRLAGLLGVARDGLKVLVGSIETGKANGEIKTQVSKAANPEVEAAVAEMNAGKAKSSTESA